MKSITIICLLDAAMEEKVTGKSDVIGTASQTVCTGWTACSGCGRESLLKMSLLRPKPKILSLYTKWKENTSQ